MLSSPDCGVLQLYELHAAAACRHRTCSTPSLQQYYHAGRSAVSAVSLLGGCVYRREARLTSESCCRSSTAARSRLSVSLDVLAAKDPNERKYAGQRRSHARAGYRCGPGVGGVRVCGGEHLFAVVSPKAEFLTSELRSCTAAAAAAVVFHRRTHATHLLHHNSQAPRRVVRSVSLSHASVRSGGGCVDSVVCSSPGWGTLIKKESSKK